VVQRGTTGCGVSGCRSSWGHHEQERRQLPLPQRGVLALCSTAPHARHPLSGRPCHGLPRHGGGRHTQATGEATNDACPGALREAEQTLIRKLRFVAQSRQEAGLMGIFYLT